MMWVQPDGVKVLGLVVHRLKSAVVIIICISDRQFVFVILVTLINMTPCAKVGAKVHAF